MGDVDKAYRKELIMRMVSDLVFDMVRHGSPLDIEVCIENGTVTIDEMVAEFKIQLEILFPNS